MAERGVDITGLELSTPSPAYARQKAVDLPIRWVEADVRSFQLDKSYALVFARGNVFNFMLNQADQGAMPARVREHLSHGGRFLFDALDYPQPDQTVDWPEEVERTTLSYPYGPETYVSGTDRYDRDRQIWIQTCTERWDDAQGELVRPPWELTLRYDTQQYAEDLLRANGLQLVTRFSDYVSAEASEVDDGAIYVCEVP